MESSSQDRQLPATQRKLDQARRDGQAARSKDLPHLAVLGTGGVALLLLAPAGFERMRAALAQAFHFNANSIAQPGDMLARLSAYAQLGLIGCAIFSAIVLFAAIGTTVATGGWVASLKSITPDLGRLNPLS